ncbi:response regulator [Flexithrix dorotheae]|uniref:response regulator n=1 Tax=Flexithrix dorotheae TaxID=70993 RepID=UPI00037D3A66|nr:response regulator [Flexithrix dorotheae]
MTSEKYNILYVDDEESNLRIFRTAFRRHYNIFTASSALVGFEILRTEDIHLIISDQRMPNMTGSEFLSKVYLENPAPIRMILTGYSDMAAIVEAINSGKIYKYITKPWEKDKLKLIFDEALLHFENSSKSTERNKQLQKEVEKLRAALLKQGVSVENL